jgi:hypothetical protein
MNGQNQACGTQGPKLGQVQEQLNALDTALAELQDEANRSTGKFESVVNSEPDITKSGEGKPDVQLVRLAEVIRSFRYRVNSVRMQLTYMNDRCEL